MVGSSPLYAFPESCAGTRGGSIEKYERCIIDPHSVVQLYRHIISIDFSLLIYQVVGLRVSSIRSVNICSKRSGAANHTA